MSALPRIPQFWRLKTESVALLCVTIEYIHVWISWLTSKNEYFPNDDDDEDYDDMKS